MAIRLRFWVFLLVPILLGVSVQLFMADRDPFLYRRALLLLVIGVGCYAVLNSGLLCVFRRKRKAGAEVEEEEELVTAGDQPVSSSEFETAEIAKENDQNAHRGMELESKGSKPQEIDEDLHSRQLAVYGRETMRRLFASDVLISGLDGLGAEIAKNVVLAGVKSVTLHDEEDVQIWDLSSNFFFSEDDIGKNRALSCAQKLHDLNNAVFISTITEKLSKEHLSKFQCLV